MYAALKKVFADLADKSFVESLNEEVSTLFKEWKQDMKDAFFRGDFPKVLERCNNLKTKISEITESSNDDNQLSKLGVLKTDLNLLVTCINKQCGVSTNEGDEETGVEPVASDSLSPGRSKLE